MKIYVKTILDASLVFILDGSTAKKVVNRYLLDLWYQGIKNGLFGSVRALEYEYIPGYLDSANRIYRLCTVHS